MKLSTGPYWLPDKIRGQRSRSQLSWSVCGEGIHVDAGLLKSTV